MYKNLQQTNHERGKQEEEKKRKENIGLHPKIKKFSASYKAKVAKHNADRTQVLFFCKRA